MSFKKSSLAGRHELAFTANKRVLSAEAEVGTLMEATSHSLCVPNDKAQKD